MGFVFVFGLVFPAVSQNASKAEVFGGYSYVNVDTNGLTSRQSANGWEAGVVGSFNRWLGAEFEANAYYKTYSVPTVANVNVRDYSYLAGPRITFKSFFVHALVGGDHLSGSALGYAASQDGLGGAFGGGIDWKVSGPWSIRASVDYVFTRHNIFGGPSYTQDNYRTGVGIAYRFGSRRHQTASEESTRTAGPSDHSSEMEISQLGITARTGAGGGAEIMSVGPGSVAELANLRVGEIITALAGQPVNSPAELASKLQGRTPGSRVSLVYRFDTGAMGWQSNEITLVLR